MTTTRTETATFAAGCFWGVEELFRKVPGVLDVTVGYTGGTTRDPGYEAVCAGGTGHAEAVQVRYNPALAPYTKLLSVFWENHNPTTTNQQGPDVGEQYRSAIFYYSPEQKAQAESSKAALEKEGTWKKPIVTQIIAATPFYRGEDYHQQYLRKQGLSTSTI